MGRYAARYSQRQRNALISEVLDNQTKLGDALRMLRDGLLVDAEGRVPAINMALTTAQDYVKRERRKRRKARAEKMSVEDPNGLLGESYSKAVETISLELHRLHYKAKSQSLSNAEVGKLERLTKMAKQHKSASVPDVEAVGSTLEERVRAAEAVGSSDSVPDEGPKLWDSGAVPKGVSAPLDEAAMRRFADQARARRF